MLKIEVQYFVGCRYAPAVLELVKQYVQEHPETKLNSDHWL